MAAIPKWVADQISIKTGVEWGGISRAAKPARCRRCKAPVIRGLDGDTCAADVSVDPQPLTALGEAVAVTTGLGSWERYSDGGRFVIDPRYPERIAARPAGNSKRNDVHARHECGRVWRFPQTRAPTSFADLTTALPNDPTF